MSKPRKYNKTTSSLPSYYSNNSSNNNEVSCNEIINYVKRNSYGTIYKSHSSDAITEVTFYSLTVDFKTSYFAIVCFMNKRKDSCREYIYKVGSQTESYYSNNYNYSAGEAFWKYINPYSDSMSCSPNLN